MKRSTAIAASAALVSLLSSGCGDRKESEDDGRLFAVATTTMIADLVRVIGGPEVRVKGLMRAGVDPHLYEPTPTDGVALREAAVVFYNGHYLEGQMSATLEKLGSKSHAVAEFVETRDLIMPEDAGGHPDPHVWGDASLWAECVHVVVTGLSRADEANASKYEDRGAEYVKELEALDAWVKKRVSEVPENGRVMVTSHDAFGYFGRAYGFEVIGLQGISTVSQAGLADRVKMVDLIRERGIKAIFVESSVASAAIESISKDSGAKIGGKLFSDALGTPGDVVEVGGERYDRGTYLGMVRHNTNTVVEALR